MSTTESSYYSSDDDSLSELSLSEAPVYRNNNNNNTNNNRTKNRRDRDDSKNRVIPLAFRDDNPPRRWVGRLESIDTEEAAFELRQQVNDSSLQGSTTQYDPLQSVQDSDPVFAALVLKSQKDIDKNIHRNMKKYSKDSELDITSLHFDPIIFLSRVHKTTSYLQLHKGIKTLSKTAATRSSNIKKLVSLHFGQFVHCKDTIDLIQNLLKPELPPEHVRLELLATRMQNLPWLLPTFTPQQQEQLYHILTNKRQQQLLQHQHLQLQHRLHARHAPQHFTFGNDNNNNTNQTTTTTTTTTGGTTSSTTVSTTISPPSSTTSSSNSTNSTTLSGAAGSITNDMASPFAYAFSTSNQAVSDKSRVGRLQLVLSTVAEKCDSIYNPLLTTRQESDRIRSALTTFRKYKLLLELPTRMKLHITNGRVDRLVHDTQRIKMISVSKNPSNYLLQEALAACHSIRSQYAQVLLLRLSDPRHNLYSQQRTMSYLFQLENKIDPTWYYLERQCLHISNLLDRAYYDSSINHVESTFISVNSNNNNKPNVLQRAANTSVDVASGGIYSYNDGDLQDDDYDDDYNLFHNGPNSLPTIGQNGTPFGQTVTSINQIAPPTSYLEYNSNNNNNNNNNNNRSMNNTQDDQSSSSSQSLPLFLRRPQHLTPSQAELIATNLLHIFTLHIQPLLRLAYNVGNGTLFDSIKSSLTSSGGGLHMNGFDIDVDIQSLTLNKHFINSKALERVMTLVGHLSSRLILYLSSLCIPNLNLNEISGFVHNVMSSTPQKAQQRNLDALDLAYSKQHPQNPTTALQRKSQQQQQQQQRGSVTSSTSSTTRSLVLSSDDSNNTFPRNTSGLGQLPTKEQLALPFDNRVGLSSTIPLQPLPHSIQFNTPTRPIGNNNTTTTPPFSSIQKQQQQQSQSKPISSSFISSVTEDDIYTQRTPLHIITLEPLKTVLPRNPRDPIQPIPVASYSHIILHLLSNLLLSLVNNNLIMLEPKILDPLLSFYVNLYQSAQSYLLISASVQIATLKENWILNPTSIFHHNQTTTLPILFQQVLDTYLQSMIMLPSKQLLVRGLLYLNAPPQFTLISDYTELVLTFADRLHSIAIPQNPTRVLDPNDDITTTTTTVTTQQQQQDKQSAAAQKAILTTTTEAITTKKVLITTTIIGKDGKKEQFTREEIVEEEATPVIDVKTESMKLGEQNQQNQSLLLDDKDKLMSQDDNKLIMKKKPITISRFGHELLSLAEQLNYNEHSNEPYSVGDVVALNAQNIYQTPQALESTNINNYTLSNIGMNADQITIATAAVVAGLNVEYNGASNQFFSSSTHQQFNSPGDDRVLLAVLSNCIHTSQTIIPRAWRNLAELLQQLWPAKEIFEMSFFLNTSTTSNDKRKHHHHHNNHDGGLLDQQTRSKYNNTLRNDLNNLKTKYNPTNRPGTRYGARTSSSFKTKPTTVKKKVQIHTGLTDSDDDDDSTDTEDSSYTDFSSDLDSLMDSDDDNYDQEINVLNLSPAIWAALSMQQQHYINTSVVGGLGVAMSLALDNSYRRVQGIYLQLQHIIVQKYIMNKTNVIYTYMNDSLYRGGINWKKAIVPSHVREFLYTILQLLVETKSELILFQNIDVSAILTTIIENTIVTWCYLVKKLRVLCYNGAMQLYLETNFLCRSTNRYSTPYGISLCRDLLSLLHAYIEETVITENISTDLHGVEGFDSEMFDAVSRVGLFSTLNKGFNGMNPNAKIDENTGYEFSTSVSPIQSALLKQQRDLRSQRRSSNQYGNENSLLHSTLKSSITKKSTNSSSSSSTQSKYAAATSLDNDNEDFAIKTGLDDDDSDDDDDQATLEDDIYYDQLEEDDEESLMSSIISMKDLKSEYNTQRVNKGLMLLFKFTRSHIDIDNLLQQALFSTRLSFATLRIDSEDPLMTLLLDETTTNSATKQTNIFERTYRTPEEIVDGYFKVRYNANRLRENIRIERTEEEKREQLVYEQWIKQNNMVYNSSLTDNELYVNLSIGQSKKYRELVTAQRNHSSTQEIKQIIQKYKTSSSTSSTTSSTIKSQQEDSSSYGGFGKYSSKTQVIEENDPEPEDFGIKVTRLVTKRKEVVEKQKLPKEPKPKKDKKDKKQQQEPEPTPVPTPPVVVNLPESSSSSSSEEEDIPQPIVETKKPMTPKVMTPKIITPKAPTPKAPTPPPTPKMEPIVIEERVVVTTTTLKQQQQLQIQQEREEEERRRKEKEALIFQQYQKTSNNLDFLDEGGNKNDVDEFDELDLQAMNFSYKVAKKEKQQQQQLRAPKESSSESSSEEEEIKPKAQFRLPEPSSDSSELSSSDDDVPPPIFKRQEVQKKEIKSSGPVEYKVKAVQLQTSQRQRRERKTKRNQNDNDDDDDDLQLDLNFKTTTTQQKSRVKKVDINDIAEEQRQRRKDQQTVQTNKLKNKIVIPEMDMMNSIQDGGAEDTSKMTIEEKRRKQIKMQIKRTKDGKYIDMATGEEIDPSKFKKQLAVPK